MRIASLAPSVTIQLQELGVAEQIVACTTLCPLPKLERQQKAVGTFSILQQEKIAAAKPDLIITATLVQIKGAARLKAAGYTVLHLDPRRLGEIADSYAVLGEAVGKKEEGEGLKKEFLRRMTPSDSPFVRGRKRLRVYMEEWPANTAGRHEPPFVAGNWVPDLVAAAGGEAVLIKPGEPSREISLEELQGADPDVIVQHACLPPLMPEATEKDHAQRERHRQVMLERLKSRQGWDSLRAVHANRVYSLDDTPFNMPTLGVLEGIEMLREVFSFAVPFEFLRAHLNLR